ncbi:Maestro heat-like repeat-containing protein family member 1 [Aphelenchoides besseyi]|nr:Maestro heat-like repeat-containing protein family member 1 [Aphelenchoides besseyi]
MAYDFEKLVSSLFACVLSTNSEDVREQIAEGIHKLGNKDPSTFLSAAHAFLLQNPKLTNPNCVFVLRAISKVLQRPNAIEVLEKQQAMLIINLATQEMTGFSKGADEECANAARDVLITLCKHDRFVGDVMDSLLSKFPPSMSTPPNRCIIMSIAAVAQQNPFAFIPFLTDVLSRTVHVLSHLKHESAKSAWARALTLFCEALVEFSASNNQSSDTESQQNGHETALIDEALQQNYADQMESAYDVVITWTYAKDSKCRADVAECIGALTLIISSTKITKDLKKIVANFLSLCKKTTELEEQQSVIRGIANFLESTCSDETIPVELYIDDLFNSLFVHICTLSEQATTTDQSTAAPNALAIKVRNEAFRCFNVAAKRFADKLVYWCIHKLQSEKESVKIGATNLIRHLLNSSGKLDCKHFNCIISLGPQMEDKRSLITMGLKPLLLEEQSVKVKMSICQLAVALADHGYVHVDGGGENVVAFLMNNLVPADDSTTVNGTTTISTRQEINSMSQFYAQCAQALLTIAKTCDSASTLLWPYLFEFVCSERYTPTLAEICKCCTILARRKKENNEEIFADLQDTSNTKIAGPHQVLARLLVCLNGAPLNSQLQRRGRECIGLLVELSPWFHNSLTDEMPKQLEELSNFLDSTTNSSDGSKENSPVVYSTVARQCNRIQKWQLAILDVLDSILQIVKDGEWRESLAAALAQQFGLYSANYPQDKAFNMRLLGFCLSRITNTTFVIEHIVLAFRSTNHGNQTERMGCAMLMGHCGQQHADLVLNELENISKWEHTKKGGGFLSRVAGYAYSKNSDSDINNLRATIILSFGYFVLYCSTDVVTQHLNKVVLPFIRNYLAGFKATTVVKEAHLETINTIATAIQPSKLNSEYYFESRYECFTDLKKYLKGEQPVELVTSWIRFLACKATASLAVLNPPLSDNELWEVGNVLTQSVFPMCREKGGHKALSSDISVALDSFCSPLSTVISSELQRSDSGASSVSFSTRAAHHSEMFDAFTCHIDDNENTTMMDATIAQFRFAIGQIMFKKPTVQTLSQLLKMFQPFYGSSSDHERIRSVESTVLILQVYLDNAVDTKLGHANDFPPLSSILGLLAPRLADSVCAVRHNAIRAIWYAFRLSLIHGGHSPQETDILDGLLFDLNDFIETYLGSKGPLDREKAREAISAIGKETDSRLPQCQLQAYLSVLFKMLTDRQSNVSDGAAQLMTFMLENRGHLLQNETKILVTTILEHLPRVHSLTNTYADLLVALRLFSTE